MGLPLALSAPLCPLEKGTLPFLWLEALLSRVQSMGWLSGTTFSTGCDCAVPNLPNRTRRPGPWEMKRRSDPIMFYWVSRLQGVGGVFLALWAEFSSKGFGV